MPERYVVSAPSDKNTMWYVIDTMCEHYQHFKQVVINPKFPDAEHWARRMAAAANKKKARRSNE